jgi:hypothetical protein
MQLKDGKVELVVANTNYTYKSNGVYGNYVKDWDKVWTCDKSQFAWVSPDRISTGGILTNISTLPEPTSVNSPEVSEMSTVDPPHKE